MVDGSQAARPSQVSTCRVGSRLRDLATWWSQIQFPGSQIVLEDRPPRYGGLFLMVLAAVLLFPGLNRPLLDPDEGRQAEVAREMLAHEDLVVPRLRGKPYLEKPPLQYWLTVAAYSAWGVEAGCARTVPAVSAWLLVLVTYLWARHAVGERPALLGGLVLCLTPGFVLIGRTVLLDTLLALWVVTAWYTAQVAVGNQRLRWGWWLASAGACGLGILTKGPVAVALLVPPVLAYQVLVRTAARPEWRSWAAYVTVAASVPAPWYIAMAVRQPGYLQDFLWRNNVVRFVNAFDHAHPWWFYLPILLAVTLPWPLLWYAVWRFLRSRDPRLARLRTAGLGFCVLAAAWGFLFFSASTCKSPPYLAPMLSPLALLMGACLEAVLLQPVAKRSLPHSWLRRRTRAVRLVGACVCAGAQGNPFTGWDATTSEKVPGLRPEWAQPEPAADMADPEEVPAGSDYWLRRVRQQLPHWTALLLFVLTFAGALGTGLLGWQSWPDVFAQIAVAVLVSLAWLGGMRRVTLDTAWKACGAATLGFMLFVAHVLAPSFTERRTPEMAARAALDWALDRGEPLILYGRPWQSALFYLQRESAIEADARDFPVLVHLLHQNPETLVLVESGLPLDEFLRALPQDLETRVRRPERVGQAALVIVRPQRQATGEKSE